MLVLVRAVAADGLKRLGVPVGTRRQEVLAEAQRLGVEVKELGGLDDAYAFLTGEASARPAPANDADMELWPAEVNGVLRATAAVRRELERGCSSRAGAPVVRRASCRSQPSSRCV